MADVPRPSLKLHVFTPHGTVAEGFVESVRARDRSGAFGICPGHERFTTALVPSVLTYRVEGAERHRGARVDQPGQRLALLDQRIGVIPFVPHPPGQGAQAHRPYVLLPALSILDGPEIEQVNPLGRWRNTKEEGPGWEASRCPGGPRRPPDAVLLRPSYGHFTNPRRITPDMNASRLRPTHKNKSTITDNRRPARTHTITLTLFRPDSLAYLATRV